MRITEKLPRALTISSFIAIFFVLGLLPFIAWLLEYKDTIAAPLTITTEVTPVDIYARSTGELKLLVDNNDFVQKDAPLALIRNTSIYEDVQLLKNKLNQKNRQPLEIAKELCLLEDLVLGELKPTFIKVNTAVEAYQNFIDSDRHEALIASREKQILKYELRKSLLDKKSTILEKDKSFEKKRFARDKKLYADNIISALEFDEADRRVAIQDLVGLENETDINALELKIETLEGEKLELKSQYDFNRLRFINSIKENLRLLETELNAWERKYLLKASVAGRCVFKEYFNDFRFARQGEKVFSLIPKEETPYFALLQLPIQGAGKVTETQEVYVKLSNYPFMEYGVLKGEVSAISALPFDSHYNVQVHFPPDLVTTYGDTLLPQPSMHGIGEIIVERKSLYERISEQLKSARLNR